MYVITLLTLITLIMFWNRLNTSHFMCVTQQNNIILYYKPWPPHLLHRVSRGYTLMPWTLSYTYIIYFATFWLQWIFIKLKLLYTVTNKDHYIKHKVFMSSFASCFANGVTRKLLKILWSSFTTATVHRSTLLTETEWHLL